MVETITHYKCDICQTIYDQLDDAEACEKKGSPKPSVQVGDIVFASAGFGWYDGNKRWISNPDVPLGQKPCPNGDGNCFNDCCTYRFYYIVTAIDNDDSEYSRSMHRRRYHLFTRAMTGKQGHHRGYTFDQDHIKPKKIEDPPTFVVRSSKGLIGQKAEYLL